MLGLLVVEILGFVTRVTVVFLCVVIFLVVDFATVLVVNLLVVDGLRVVSLRVVDSLVADVLVVVVLCSTTTFEMFHTFIFRFQTKFKQRKLGKS